MGDGPTDINTPFLKDPFCLKHSVVDRAELTGQAVVKTHAPRRHGIPLCFFDQNREALAETDRGAWRGQWGGESEDEGDGNWGRLLSEALMGFLRQGSAHLKGEVWSQVILVPSGVWNSCQNKLSWECKARLLEGQKATHKTGRGSLHEIKAHCKLNLTEISSLKEIFKKKMQINTLKLKCFTQHVIYGKAHNLSINT